MDFSTYKFRPSGLCHLMTTSRSKSDPLSDTAKTYLRDIWIEQTFNRHKPDITGHAAAKGTMVESDSLDLYQKVTGQVYFKNQKKLENDYIKGTPDVIGEDLVIDIKSSWSIWTFAATDEKSATKNYFWQVLGYMWLARKKKAELAYCLVNTPETIINDEIYRLSFKFGDEEAEKFRVNYIFDDIDPKLRLKTFSFVFDQESVDKLTERIGFAREFLNNMHF